MKEAIQQHLATIYAQPVQINNIRSVGGGCINETSILTLSNGQKVFLKYHPNPPADFFSIEARGLALLEKAEAGAPEVPKVLGFRPHYLLLEYIEERPASVEFYAQFGRALAAMHHTTQTRYGLDHDNFIGKTVQKNTLETDAVTFYREHRFRFQQNLARKAGKLPKSLDSKLDKLCENLDKWLYASEKPALLHGDLWSGNYFAGGRPQSPTLPFVFDPAVYFGLREADLAMTELFGRLPQAFYDAYNEAFPLRPGYQERKELFNLYHLLNHLNLFGASYLGSVEQTISHLI